MSRDFKIESPFAPAGDQPQAIKELCEGIANGEKNQVLLGVTGSGKTFTMAKIIEQSKRPALIMAPNKILAAQLYSEMKEFFPENHVEYFVSYYDYYQPEAYVPKTDTYIEKDSAINEQIDRMRNAATRNILEDNDVIIVASVSCIYGLGDVESYSQMTIPLKVGDEINPREVHRRLAELQYERNQQNFVRSTFRVQGDVLDIFPAHYEDRAWRISFFGDEIESISEFDSLTGKKTADLKEVTVYPANHYVTPRPALSQAIAHIKEELGERLDELKSQNKLLEAQRLEQRTRFDLEMLEATGHCKGIENYSRYLTGRPAGAPPPTLFEYLPPNAIIFIDESHISVPQIGGMYRGDYNRKSTLADYGFRLPSCVDNRPLKFDEWNAMRGQTIFVSATPGDWELEQSGGSFVEQVIRPTGLADPVCVVRPVENQIDDLMEECRKVIAKGERVLVTTLTKRMAEELNTYLLRLDIRCNYIHSDVDTLERIQIIEDLRNGLYDVLIGVNLLREGLDLPEVSLVAILDADKEGFLRSHRSLTQTAGRAARNLNGMVIMYADKITESMQKTIDETNRRREKQLAYNEANHITPQAIQKARNSILTKEADVQTEKGQPILYKEEYDISHVNIAADPVVQYMNKDQLKKAIENTRKAMVEAAKRMEFIEAAQYRDELVKLQDRYDSL